MLPNIATSTYPIPEPTSALTFGDLLTEIAYKINVAYYGSTGTGAPQAPIDPHDLAICSRIVNKAIRMFISDGPNPNGWKWLKPIAQVDLFPTIAADSTLGQVSWVTFLSYDSTNNLTTVNLNYASTVPASTIGAASTNAAPIWYPSMELRQIFLGGNPPPNTPGWFQPPNTVSTSTTGVPYTIVNFINNSTVQLWGSTASTRIVSTGSTTWSMATTGDYTLPADFGGSFAGEITFIQNTNRGTILQWIDEGALRMRRQNYNQESGTPYQCAVRLMPTPSVSLLQGTYYPQRRRWELMTWRISNEFLHILFPYVLAFSNLTQTTDVPPSPFLFDEALKAACFAVAEKEVEDTLEGPDWTYYTQRALPNAWRIDAMSSPKRIGYIGNPSGSIGGWGAVIDGFRNWNYQRPDVNVTARPP